MITRVILRFTLLGCLVLVSLVLPANAAGTLAGTALELPLVAAPKTAAGQLPDPQVWTTWGANQYALAEDGESIWIGATGGAVRWNHRTTQLPALHRSGWPALHRRPGGCSRCGREPLVRR